LLQCRQRATFLFDDDPVLSRVLCLASFPSVGFISKPRSLLSHLLCRTSLGTRGFASVPVPQA
jgi:hypothetical protein